MIKRILIVAATAAAAACGIAAGWLAYNWEEVLDGIDDLETQQEDDARATDYAERNAKAVAESFRAVAEAGMNTPPADFFWDMGRHNCGMDDCPLNGMNWAEAVKYSENNPLIRYTDSDSAVSAISYSDFINLLRNRFGEV